MEFLRDLLCEEMYEITSTDTNKTARMTRQEAERYFGKIEFQEILAGYLPNFVAVKLDETAAAGATSAGSVAGFRGSLFGNGRNRDLRGRLDKKLKKMGFKYINEQEELPSTPASSVKPTFDTQEVVSKLQSAEKSSEVNKNTVAFGLEDDQGNVVKVYVREEQAEDFEHALGIALENDTTTQPEIAEILFELREKFDIVDVVWPQIPEDEEQEAEAPPEGTEGELEGPEGELGDEEPGEGEMVADEDMADETEAESALQAVIGMMKADAEARKAEANARKAEAQAREAGLANQAAEAKIKKEEEVLDMDDFYGKNKEEDEEAKRLTKLAKYRHDLAKEASGKLGESVGDKKKKKKDERNPTTGVPEHDTEEVDPTTGVPLKQKLSFQGYLKYARDFNQAQR
ncbi:hypothetical protein LCGC14_1708660 [marine sediment metagenome]|uniref:Uncharacterized protein n=1 Tax=marine sediment metagenome TaxID=412755 RepID=A0A0F9HGD5_9ZZZZ